MTWREMVVWLAAILGCLVIGGMVLRGCEAQQRTDQECMRLGGQVIGQERNCIRREQ